MPGKAQLGWSGWLHLPRETGAISRDRRIAKFYSRIDGDRVAENGNNALRILELAQVLRRCPSHFVVPKSTLETLKKVRIVEEDLKSLQVILDKIVTGQPVSKEEIGAAQEIFKSLGLSMNQKPSTNLYEIRSEVDKVAVERSASEARKLNITNHLRELTEKISIKVSDFAVDLFEKNKLLMSEGEEKELIKNIILLQRGIDIEQTVSNINRILAPYNFKLKCVGPRTYELTSRAALTILSGPSGVGKGSTVQALLDEGLLKLTFFTCRPRRGPTADKPEGEFYGIDYFFIEQERYIDLVLRHDFFVARYGVHGKYQGVHNKVFEVVLGSYDLYAEMDIHLAHQVLERYEANGIDIRNIFLVPPEYREHLGRLIGRYLQQADFTKSHIDMEDLAKRANNGVDEILASITLPPSAIFIVNEELANTSAELRTAMGWEPAATLLDTGAEEAYRISGRLSVAKYKGLADARDLRPVNPELLVLNAYPKLMDRFVASVVYRLTAPSRETQDTLVRIASEAIHEIKEAVWKSLRLKTKDGQPLGPDPKPNLGLKPGTLSPAHEGHTTASYAGLLSANLNGVVHLPGGETTDRPFALAAEHRQAMVDMAYKNNPWILQSPLRIEMAEYFRSITDVTLGVKGTERKLALDVIAFNWLIHMNPHAAWRKYLAGVNKVNDYGQAKGVYKVRGCTYNLKGKNEQQLIYETLAQNNIDILYFDRRGQENIVEEVEPADSWLRELIEKAREQGRELFKRCEMPSLDISETNLRRMLQEYDPRINDALDPKIIDYIFKPLKTTPEIYTDPSGKKRTIEISLLQALILESRAAQLGRLLRSENLKPAQLEEMQKELDEINMQKKILAHQGVLADDRPLTLEELKRL